MIHPSKLIIFILALSIFLFASNSNACMNDFDCGFGNQCVKPRDAVGLEGICITPTDQNGIKQYNYEIPSAETHEIAGCQFNTDCDIGFSCFKKSGELYGVCIK